MKKIFKRFPFIGVLGLAVIVALIFASGSLGKMLGKPNTASGSLAYGETRQALRVMSDFKSENYTRQEKTSPVYDAIGTTLSSDNDIFFVFSNSLWYNNGNEAILALEGVSDIAGCDENGLYVVENDNAITPVSKSGASGETASSIAFYNPVEGTVQTILPGAQAGLVSGQGSMANLFYAVTEAADGEHDYRWTVKKMNLEKKDISDVFADDYITTFDGGTKKAATKITFSSFEGHVNIQFLYPYGGGSDYTRWVRISAVGAMIGDSVAAPVYMGNNVSFYQNSPIYENHIIDCGSFKVKMTIDPDTGLYLYTAIDANDAETILGTSQTLGVSNGAELFYYAPTQTPASPASHRLSSTPPSGATPPESEAPDSSQEPPSTQTPPATASIRSEWMVYNGKSSLALELEGEAFQGDVLAHADKVYLLGQYRTGDLWKGQPLPENTVALYRCTPSDTNVFAAEKLFITKTLGTIKGIEGPYLWEYAPSYTVIKNFILINTSSPTNILVYNLQNSSYAHVGTEDFALQ